MNLNEVANFLGWNREQVKSAISHGVTPPGRTAPVPLEATPRETDYEIIEEELDAFVAAFEAEEPGRHPPIAVRRQLFVEARERCCICGEPGPFEFHHLIDWAKLAHHDPQHMMLLCRNCHGKCTKGTIDHQRQRQYKENPYWRGGLFASLSPGINITWGDFRAVVTALHAQLKQGVDGDPRHDYTYIDVERKNELNRLSADYYAMWQREYEPKFLKLKSFLGDDRNTDMQELYYEIVGDLRSEIAAIQGHQPDIAFDDVLRRVFEAAFGAFSNGPKVNREALRTLIAFMYFECDIGRK